MKILKCSLVMVFVIGTIASFSTISHAQTQSATKLNVMFGDPTLNCQGTGICQPVQTGFNSPGMAKVTLKDPPSDPYATKSGKEFTHLLKVIVRRRGLTKPIPSRSDSTLARHKKDFKSGWYTFNHSEGIPIKAKYVGRLPKHQYDNWEVVIPTGKYRVKKHLFSHFRIMVPNAIFRPTK